MARHFKIEELLGREEYEQLKEFAREPARTIDDVLEWMLAKGLKIGRTACGNWLREFLMTDRYDAGNAAAKAIMEKVKTGGGVVALNEANNAAIAAGLFETINDLIASGKATTKDFANLTLSIKRSMDVNTLIREARRALLEELSAKARAGGGVITQADLDEVGKSIFG